MFLDNSRIRIWGSLKEPGQIEVSGSREDSLFRSYPLDSIFEQKTGMEIMLNYPDHVFSAFVAYYQFQIHQIESDVMDRIVQGFSESVKGSEYYDHLFSLYSVIKRVAISQPSPDFALPDVHGDIVHLKDFRGKYVLLDFWASWCPPCRAANPDLVRIYHQYKEKGFTIVGISVDKKRDRWLEAITRDQLVWPNLSALDGWGAITQLYGVKAVPQNFLIDPQGIIVGKNLEIEGLQDELQDRAL